jgi:hypothetical protein
MPNSEMNDRYNLLIVDFNRKVYRYFNRKVSSYIKVNTIYFIGFFSSFSGPGGSLP